MVNKLYTPVNWKNYPSKDTPMTATNLNKMDSGIDDLDDRLVSVANSQETMESDIDDIEEDISTLNENLTTSTNEQFKFDKQDGKYGYIAKVEGADTFFPFSSSDANPMVEWSVLIGEKNSWSYYYYPQFVNGGDEIVSYNRADGGGNYINQKGRLTFIKGGKYRVYYMLGGGSDMSYSYSTPDTYRFSFVNKTTNVTYNTATCSKNSHYANIKTGLFGVFECDINENDAIEIDISYTAGRAVNSSSGSCDYFIEYLG